MALKLGIEVQRSLIYNVYAIFLKIRLYTVLNKKFTKKNCVCVMYIEVGIYFPYEIEIFIFVLKNYYGHKYFP